MFARMGGRYGVLNYRHCVLGVEIKEKNGKVVSCGSD